MPLTAESRDKESDQAFVLIDITAYEEPRLDLVGLELRCPECKTAMHVRQPLGRIAHFAHNPHARGDTPCAMQQGESIKHIYAKAEICNKLAALGGYAGAEIIKEHWLASISRRADVMVKFPDGGFEVHEIQLAAISVDELEARTSDYRRAGAQDVIWWFGGNADHQNNKKWAAEKLGGYGHLQVYEQQVPVF